MLQDMRQTGAVVGHGAEADGEGAMRIVGGEVEVLGAGVMAVMLQAQPEERHLSLIHI